MTEVLFVRLDEYLTETASLQAQISAIAPIDDPNIIGLAALPAATGILVETANGTPNTFTQRSIVGTANQITVTNGSGVAGNPTLSLPTALTFTGFTITGGTFATPTLNTPIIAIGTPTAAGELGYGASINFGDGTANHGLTANDLVQTLTNKTITSPTITGATITGGTVSSLGTPIAVGDGGTGHSTLTAHFLLVGNGTGGVNLISTSVGSGGLALISQGVADPIYAQLGNGGLQNSSVTIGSTSVALGATAATISGLTLVAPALGTPASGIATNLTGTASGLTAGNVTTNANLTGDVTSIGNATTLASVASAGTTGSSTAIPVITINAKGLTTSITTAAVVAPAGTLTGTTLASNVTASSLTSVGTLAGLTVTGSFTATGLVTNADLANSTISGIALGANLATLTFGTHLANGGSSYNGSTGITITSDATPLSVNSTIMARDGSGQVAAAIFTGSLIGHASLDLALTGGTMSGAIAMGTNAITGLTTLASAGAMTFQSNGSTFAGNISTGQQWLLGGTAITPSTGVILTVSGATTSPPATGVSVNPVAEFLNVDGTPARIYLRNFGTGGQPAVNYFTARGTSAAPTATQSGDFLASNFGIGYATSGGAGYVTGAGGGFGVAATENYTSTSAGSKVVIFATPTGGASAGQVAFFFGSGGLGLNTNNDPGAGLIYQNSASFLMRTKTSWNTGAAAGAGTLTNAPASGNPTKWIPVDDNGTTRYIPAW
jgi:hypothetical protein